MKSLRSEVLLALYAFFWIIPGVQFCGAPLGGALSYLVPTKIAAVASVLVGGFVAILFSRWTRWCRWLHLVCMSIGALIICVFLVLSIVWHRHDQDVAYAATHDFTGFGALAAVGLAAGEAMFAIAILYGLNLLLAGAFGSLYRKFADPLPKRTQT